MLNKGGSEWAAQNALEATGLERATGSERTTGWFYSLRRSEWAAQRAPPSSAAELATGSFCRISPLCLLAH